LRDDKELIAGIIGAISIIPSEIVSQILVISGFNKYSILSLSSMIITFNRPSLIMGLCITPVVGALVAILLYHLFIKYGSEHLVIKCVGASMLMWIALELVFTMYIEGRFFPIRPVSDYYAHLIAAVIFGITEGILFNRFLFYKAIEHNH